MSRSRRDAGWLGSASKGYQLQPYSSVLHASTAALVAREGMCYKRRTAHGLAQPDDSESSGKSLATTATRRPLLRSSIAVDNPTTAIRQLGRFYEYERRPFLGMVYNGGYEGSTCLLIREQPRQSPCPSSLSFKMCMRSWDGERCQRS